MEIVNTQINVMCLERVNISLCEGKSYLTNLFFLWSVLPKHVSYERPFDMDYLDSWKAFGKIPSPKAFKYSR